MGKNQEYKVLTIDTWKLLLIFDSFQQLFEKIDQEDDGEIYLKEVVMFLRAINADVDENIDV